MKLTDQQKLEKKQRDAINVLCNRILSAHNFKTIKVWADVYRMQGISDLTNYENKDNVVSFQELRAYCEKIKEELSGKIVQSASINSRETSVNESSSADVRHDTEKKQSGVNGQSIDMVKEEQDSDYGLMPSPNERAFLYWFQKKAAAQLLEGFK